ncbi:MAG: 4Fe-4S binding protein [Candidatus Thorarchaeota archaeon]|nr:MAG: 4Fe-4S binding protein [Candidatus Thorarchaeota archaeon]
MIPTAINEECCKGCGNCVKVCRYGVYENLDDKPQVAHIAYCKECGECIKECPEGCIQFRDSP